MKFTGVRHGPARLHRVLTIGGSMIPVPSVPLFYGLRFSGCRVTLRFSEPLRLPPYGA